ncbi:transporter substrate-binding domain-containing protein [Planctomycetota bacterium]|nr:transporter substrate-binding domain-containing protein [Planctomycetota bacterium]
MRHFSFAAFVAVLFLSVLGCDQDKSTKVVLTEEERAWLSSLERPIKVGLTLGWPPMSFIDENGKWQGISAEYLRLIEAELGVKFDVVLRDKWEDGLNDALSYEVDLTANISMTPERQKLLRFSRSISDDVIVVVGMKDIFGEKFQDVSGLKNYKIGVLKGGTSYKYMKSLHPDWNYVLFDNMNEGLIQMFMKQVDAVAVLEVYGDYQIEQRVEELVKIYKTPMRMDTRFAVRKDWELFAGMVDKVLGSLSESERKAIHDKWISWGLEDKGGDGVFGWVIGSLGVLLLISLIGWQRSRMKYREMKWLYECGGTSKDVCDNEKALWVDGGRRVVPTLSCVCYGRADLNRRITEANDQMCAFLGYGRDELIGFDWSSLGHVEDLLRMSVKYDRMIAGECDYLLHNNPIIGGDGNVRDGVVLMWVTRDEAGETDGVAVIMINMCELRDESERRGVLMRELDHRVKNNLAEVMALVERSSDQVDVGEFKRTLGDRLKALARMHEALAMRDWESLELCQIFRLATKPYVHEGSERVRCGGERLIVPLRTCSPLSMTLHELAANAAKYGALSCKDGEVEFTWERIDDCYVWLRWKERGGPRIDEPGYTGFGTKLIKGLVEFELQGDVKMDYQEDGLVCELKIKLISDRAISEHPVMGVGV